MKATRADLARHLAIALVAAEDALRYADRLDQAAVVPSCDAARLAFRALKNAVGELGAIARTLPVELTARHSGVAWDAVASLEDLATRRYFDIEPAVLRTAVRDLFPKLVEAVVAELDSDALVSPHGRVHADDGLVPDLPVFDALESPEYRRVLGEVNARYARLKGDPTGADSGPNTAPESSGTD